MAGKHSVVNRTAVATKWRKRADSTYRGWQKIYITFHMICQRSCETKTRQFIPYIEMYEFQPKTNAVIANGLSMPKNIQMKFLLFNKINKVQNKNQCTAINNNNHLRANECKKTVALMSYSKRRTPELSEKFQFRTVDLITLTNGNREIVEMPTPTLIGIYRG